VALEGGYVSCGSGSIWDRQELIVIRRFLKTRIYICLFSMIRLLNDFIYPFATNILGLLRYATESSSL